MLLNEPGRWSAVQARVGPGDFAAGPVRDLAEIYWDHQRNEGEPELADLVSSLDGPLKSLAVALSREVDPFDPARVVADGVAFFEAESTRRRAARSDEGGDEVARLKLAAERAKRADLRRRTGS